VALMVATIGAGNVFGRSHCLLARYGAAHKLTLVNIRGKPAKRGPTGWVFGDSGCSWRRKNGV
jgi:hypothetical protein